MALAAVVLFTDLNQQLADPAEGRQAEVPREMLAHHDWLVPRFGGVPYYEKPPLQYWLTAAAYAVWGPRAWVARLIPVGAACLAVLITYCWGCRYHGLRAGVMAGVVLCLTPGFVLVGRMAILDSLLATCVLAAWYAAHVAQSRSTLHWGWWLLSACACGLGVLTKGPVAFILFVPPVLLYNLLTTSATRCSVVAWLCHLLVGMCVAAPWYVAMGVCEPGYLEHFLWRDNVLRFVAPVQHRQPFWFYVPVLFGATLPWSLLWPWLGYFVFSRQRAVAVYRSPAMGFAVLAAGWCVLFFSLAGGKSPPYLAPALAPLALVVGVCGEAIIFQALGKVSRFWSVAAETLPRRATALILCVMKIGPLVAGWCGFTPWPWVMAQCAALLVLFALWLRFAREVGSLGAWIACAITTALFVVLSGRDAVDAITTRHAVADAAHIARRQHERTALPLICYGRQWASAWFYLRREDLTCISRRDELLAHLDGRTGALILVENGPMLDDLLGTLPPSFETDVRAPGRVGQTAVLQVRSRMPIRRPSPPPE
jgi:dolichol-phosphate mannosyltransferase